MNIKKISRDWDFLSLVRPPDKNDCSNDHCFAFRDRELLLLDKNGSLKVPSMNDIENMGISALRSQYLGELRISSRDEAETISCFSMELGLDADNDVMDRNICSLSLKKAMSVLEEPLSSIAGKAVQIMEWDRNTRFCGRCGFATELKENERAKECPECRHVIFPRISPAIIVMIEKEDRILLARSPHFRSGMYSIIAGFVEPGESAEEAVAREVMEEVGISIKNIRYFGSQPWPYPDSFMIGFTAEFAEGDIEVDGVEIEDADWYTKDEIPNVPGTDSISGQLIRYFIDRHS